MPIVDLEVPTTRSYLSFSVDLVSELKVRPEVLLLLLLSVPHGTVRFDVDGFTSLMLEPPTARLLYCPKKLFA